MPLTIELPDDVESRARSRIADLEASAREACLVDLYRRRIITSYELRQLLRVDRAEVDALLMDHGVSLEMDADEVAEDAQRLRRVRRAVGADRR